MVQYESYWHTLCPSVISHECTAIERALFDRCEDLRWVKWRYTLLGKHLHNDLGLQVFLAGLRVSPNKDRLLDISGIFRVEVDIEIFILPPLFESFKRLSVKRLHEMTHFRREAERDDGVFFFTALQEIEAQKVRLAPKQ